MKQIKTSKNNIGYLDKILDKNSATETFCVLHETGPSLKIGRKYIKKKTEDEIRKIGNDELEKEIKNIVNNPHEKPLESIFPKSQLTLKRSELDSLIEFLQENYEPFKDGIKKYIPIQGDGFNDNSANTLLAIFQTNEKQKLIKFVLENNLIQDDLTKSLEIKNKELAVIEFQKMLESDSDEATWQNWFKKNAWILGSDIVEILNERPIDTKNIADFLIQSPDGYLDIIEIKRPQIGKIDFWSKTKDHDNIIPSTALIKAIMQSTNYIYEVEREWAKLLEKTNTKVIKPRCVLIFGRSNDWQDDHYKYYRMLNASYHNISIMTYDQVLERAKRILKKITEKQK